MHNKEGSQVVGSRVLTIVVTLVVSPSSKKQQFTKANILTFDMNF